eukprot:4063914-Pleurochrysis_carterae.AAC.4
MRHWRLLLAGRGVADDQGVVRAVAAPLRRRMLELVLVVRNHRKAALRYAKTRRRGGNRATGR